MEDAKLFVEGSPELHVIGTIILLMLGGRWSVRGVEHKW